MIFQRLKKYFLDLIFPRFCVSCKKEGSYLCKKCLKEINLIDIENPIFRSKKSRFVKEFIFCIQYERNPLIQKLIKIFKYQFSEDLSDFFSQFLEKQLNGFFNYHGKPDNFIFIPVPLHLKRQKWRGFNQSQLLTRHLAKTFNTTSISLLERTKNTKAQAQLPRQERLINLENAFSLRAPPENFKLNTNMAIFLVDDVTTTGTTLNECAKILIENGFSNVYALTIGG